MDESCFLTQIERQPKDRPVQGGRGRIQYRAAEGVDCSPTLHTIQHIQPSPISASASTFLPPKNRKQQRKRQVSWLILHRFPRLPIRLADSGSSGVAPYLQWRDRAGLAPGFPFKQIPLLDIALPASAGNSVRSLRHLHLFPKLIKFLIF